MTTHNLQRPLTACLLLALCCVTTQIRENTLSRPCLWHRRPTTLPKRSSITPRCFPQMPPLHPLPIQQVMRLVHVALADFIIRQLGCMCLDGKIMSATAWQCRQKQCLCNLHISTQTGTARLCLL
jgi:hypothetical protein